MELPDDKAFAGSNVQAMQSLAAMFKRCNRWQQCSSDAIAGSIRRQPVGHTPPDMHGEHRLRLVVCAVVRPGQASIRGCNVQAIAGSIRRQPVGHTTLHVPVASQKPKHMPTARGDMLGLCACNGRGHTLTRLAAGLAGSVP